MELVKMVLMCVVVFIAGIGIGWLIEYYKDRRNKRWNQ